MSFLEKLKNGLSKTKNALMGGIHGIMRNFVRVDEDFLDEVSDVRAGLYASDGTLLYGEDPLSPHLQPPRPSQAVPPPKNRPKRLPRA